MGQIANKKRVLVKRREGAWGRKASPEAARKGHEPE